MTEDTTPVESQPRAVALSKELSEFLLEFSIGVHRYAMYPPDHPSLVPAAGNVMRKLAGILSDRRTLSIGVAHHQLVIQGLATESKHPVLADLSRRLHEHQLGAVSFGRGTAVGEVEALLDTLAQDSEREGQPLGLLPPEEFPRWAHITLYPVGYEKLELVDEGEGGELEPDGSTELWLGLARSAMGSDGEIDPNLPPDAKAVAQSIQNHNQEAAYDQVIVGYLLQLAEELKTGHGREAKSIQKKVSGLIRELDLPTLGRLVEMGGSETQRKNFILDANQCLAVDAVVKIVQAAADVSGQTISHSLTRLLAKLSAHAESGPVPVRDPADSALRDNVEDLLKDWDLTDPNPDAYTLILDSMASAAPVFQVDEEEETENVTGAHRLLHMSFEVDSWGPTVAKAVVDLMEAGEVSYLLELASQAKEGSEVAECLTDFITAPPQLRRLLSGEDVDEETLATVIKRTGSASIPVLLEVLIESEARSIRRKVFDVLVGFGHEVGPPIMEKLDDPRWYVLRNMLALVNRLPDPPQGFSAGPFLGHEDARVRREAFSLAIRPGNQRERAIAAGVSDDDERMLRMALLEAQRSLPETLVPVLIRRVVQAERPPEIRAMAVKALDQSRSNLVLEALLDVCILGRSFLGRIKLAPPSEEVLAAVRILGTQWADHPKAGRLLKAARRSRNRKIKAALAGEEGKG